MERDVFVSIFSTCYLSSGCGRGSGAGVGLEDGGVEEPSTNRGR